MKNSILVLICGLFLTACAETPVKEEVVSATPPSNQLTVKVYSFDQQLPLTGKTVHVFARPAEVGGVLNSAHLRELVEFLQSYFEYKDFVIADRFAKGYSTVSIGGDQHKPAFDSWGNPKVNEMMKALDGDVPKEGSTVHVEETEVKDGKLVKRTVVTDKTVLNRLVLCLDVNAYGLRPRRKFYFMISSEAALDSKMTEIFHMVVDQLDTFKLKPPPINEKMKGDPGCIPRFGFETVKKADGGNHYYEIDEIIPKSAAQKIDLRVGDRIEAIDSLPYGEWERKDTAEAYEKRFKLPVKIVRKGEVLRKTIQAEIMCN